MSASAVVYTFDMPKLEAFYSGAIGLALVESGGTYRVLESEGLELVLIQAPPRLAESLAPTNPPRRRSDAPTKLVFAVRNIAAVRARAAEFGGSIDPEDSHRHFRNSLRCDGIDPDGNIFQLRQLGAAG